MSFGDKVIRFIQQLHYTGGPLPDGIRIMNPFREFPETASIVKSFYEKYYNDNRSRYIIWGINPGRHGAGLTGIPFTDPKRLVSECGIAYSGKMAHEPSSVFIYEMINAYGGADKFYEKYFINSPCPLGFTSADISGREKNYNYYDSPKLVKAVQGFMIESMQKIIRIGVERKTCFCLGTGKNEKFLNKLNQEHKMFGEIIALEHPRFILQYKNASKQYYIDKYLEAFRKAGGD